MKEEANIVVDTFIRVPMAHQTHKLSNTKLEQDTYERLCLE